MFVHSGFGVLFCPVIARPAGQRFFPADMLKKMFFRLELLTRPQGHDITLHPISKAKSYDYELQTKI